MRRAVNLWTAAAQCSVWLLWYEWSSAATWNDFHEQELWIIKLDHLNDTKYYYCYLEKKGSTYNSPYISKIIMLAFKKKKMESISFKCKYYSNSGTKRKKVDNDVQCISLLLYLEEKIFYLLILSLSADLNITLQMSCCHSLKAYQTFRFNILNH